MIALRSDLPLLRVGDHQLMEYDAKWIAWNLRQAANRTGREDWWIADDIAHGVLSYLKHRYQDTTITVEILVEKIRKTLAKIGFSDIGTALELQIPRVTLDLLELAKESGRLQLIFLPKLESRLRELIASGATDILCVHARAACQALAGKKIWSPEAAGEKRQIEAMVDRMGMLEKIEFDA
jgi:hypothetical protein